MKKALLILSILNIIACGVDPDKKKNLREPHGLDQPTLTFLKENANEPFSQIAKKDSRTRALKHVFDYLNDCNWKKTFKYDAESLPLNESTISKCEEDRKKLNDHKSKVEKAIAAQTKQTQNAVESFESSLNGPEGKDVNLYVLGLAVTFSHDFSLSLSQLPCTKAGQKWEIARKLITEKYPDLLTDKSFAEIKKLSPFLGKIGTTPLLNELHEIVKKDNNTGKYEWTTWDTVQLIGALIAPTPGSMGGGILGLLINLLK